MVDVTSCSIIWRNVKEMDRDRNKFWKVQILRTCLEFEIASLDRVEGERQVVGHFLAASVAASG